jgi:hypothetical protein
VLGWWPMWPTVVGLSEGLSVAMAPTKQRRRGHDLAMFWLIWR